MPSAAVKVKSLLICKHLLEKGNPHFQKELQHNVNAIRACLGNSSFPFFWLPAGTSFFFFSNYVDFRGPPDPVRGDAVYKAVRDKATVCLSYLYCLF